MGLMAGLIIAGIIAAVKSTAFGIGVRYRAAARTARTIARTAKSSLSSILKIIKSVPKAFSKGFRAAKAGVRSKWGALKQKYYLKKIERAPLGWRKTQKMKFEHVKDLATNKAYRDQWREVQAFRLKHNGYYPSGWWKWGKTGLDKNQMFYYQGRSLVWRGGGGSSSSFSKASSFWRRPRRVWPFRGVPRQKKAFNWNRLKFWKKRPPVYSASEQSASSVSSIADPWTPPGTLPSVGPRVIEGLKHPKPIRVTKPPQWVSAPGSPVGPGSPASAGTPVMSWKAWGKQPMPYYNKDYLRSLGWAKPQPGVVGRRSLPGSSTIAARSASGSSPNLPPLSHSQDETAKKLEVSRWDKRGFETAAEDGDDGDNQQQQQQQQQQEEEEEEEEMTRPNSAVPTTDAPEMIDDALNALLDEWHDDHGAFTLWGRKPEAIVVIKPSVGRGDAYNSQETVLGPRRNAAVGSGVRSDEASSTSICRDLYDYVKAGRGAKIQLAGTSQDYKYCLQNESGQCCAGAGLFQLPNSGGDQEALAFVNGAAAGAGAGMKLLAY